MNKKYIVVNYDTILDITEPTNLLPLPQLPIISGLTISNELLYDRCDRLTSIDGMGLECDGYTIYYCDYCLNDCDKQYYYCYDCKKDMCKSCFDSFDNLDNQDHEPMQITEHTVLQCKLHDLYVREPKCSYCRCQICKNVIVDETLYCIQYDNIQYDNIQYDNHNNIYSYKEPLNFDDSVSLCIVCSETTMGQEIITEKSLKQVNNNIVGYCDCIDFGSMCDWVQIYYDNMDNIILFNYNADAKLAGKYAIAGSSNKYESIFCYSLNLTLDEIVKKIEEYHKNDLENGEYDSSPIKQLLTELNFQIGYTDEE